MSDTLPRLITDVSSFEVRCSIGQFVMDGPDEGRAPDLAAMGGKVTIAPDLKKPLRVRGDTPLGDRIVGVNALVFTIDPETGQLVHPDSTVGVELIDPNDDRLDPKGWTYTATVSPAEGNRWSVTFGGPGDGDRIVNIGALAGVEISPGQGANVVQQVVSARDESTAAAITAASAAGEASASATYAAEVAYGQPLSVTDTVFAGIVTRAGATSVTLGKNFQRGVNVDDFGAVGDGVTDDRVAIQAAVNAGQALGIPVRFTSGRIYSTNFNIVVSAPVTLTGYGATLRARSGATAIRVSSSYVTVEGLTIIGNGAGAFKGAERGILSLGTAAAPFVGCRIRDVNVGAMGDTAIRIDWWTDAAITGGNLTDLAYAGIIAQSAQRVRFDGVVVRDVWQHDADQSYGISVTDSVNTVEGRSRDVTVNGCTVANVAHWTGLSTHGGERISFTNNRVLGCHRGIIYGAGNPDRVVTAVDGLVAGNIIDGAGAGESVGLGVIGQSTGAASTAFRSGNLIKNYARPIEATTNGVWLEGSS